MFMLRRAAMAAVVLAVGLLSTLSNAQEIDKYMPAEPDVIVSIDVRAFLESSIIKEKVPELVTKLAGPIVTPFLDQEEFKGKMMGKEADVKKALNDKDEFRKGMSHVASKVNKIIVAVDTEVQKNVIVIVRGDFGIEEVTKSVSEFTKVKPDGIKKLEDRADTYEIDMNGEKSYLTLAEKGVIVFSPAKEFFFETLKAAGQTSAKKENADVKEMLKSVNQKAAIWGVGEIEKSKEIKGFAFEIESEDALNFKIHVDFPTADEASKKTTEGNQALAGAPQMLDNLPNPAMAAAAKEVLKSVKLTSSDKTVSLEFKITKENLDSLMK